jgi:hypothetical protein
MNEAMVLFDSQIDTSKATKLDDGSARMEVRLAPKGLGYAHGTAPFDLGDKELDAAIANFKARGGPVPVTIGHHAEKERQKQPAAAWIENLYKKTVGGETFLAATMRFLKKTWSSIESGEFMFLSMEFWVDDTDQHGNAIGMNVDGCAILNYPFFPLRFDQSKPAGSMVFLSRFSLVALTVKEMHGEFCIVREDGSATECFPTREEAEAKLASSKAPAVATGKKPATGKESTTMKQIEDAELVQLTKDREELVALKKKIADDEKAGAGNAELLTLRSRVTELETANAAHAKAAKATRIRLSVSRLADEHKVFLQLGDYDLSNDDKAIEFLEKEKPFGHTTVEGLEKLSTDIEAVKHLPRVKLGDEVTDGKPSAGKGKIDLSTPEGKTEAVRQRVVELRKKFGDAVLESHLKQRRQSAEDYARMELKHENPNAGF